MNSHDEDGPARRRGARQLCRRPVPVTNLWVAGVACGTTVLVSFNLAIVTCAVEPITNGMAMGLHRFGWLISGYGIGFAASLAVAHHVSAAIGRKSLALTGLFTFAVVSELCAVAPNSVVFVVARAMQGAAAAIAVAPMLSLAPVVNARFRQPMAVSVWSGTAACALVAGPSAGALISSFWGWRAIFWIDLPLCAALAAIAAWRLPSDGNARRRSPEWPGVAMLGGGGWAAVLASIAGILSWSPSFDWPAGLLGLAAVTAVVVRVRRYVQPDLDVRLWNVTVAAAAVVSMVFGVVLSAYLMAVSILLTRASRWEVVESTTTAVAILSASVACATRMRQSTACWTVALGMTLAAAGSATLASQLVADTTLRPTWALVAVVFGASAGLVAAALPTAVSTADGLQANDRLFTVTAFAALAGGGFGASVFTTAATGGSDKLASAHRVFAGVAAASVMGAVAAGFMLGDRFGSGTAEPPSKTEAEAL